MSKKIWISLVLLALLLSLWYLKYIYGWEYFRPNTDTPKQFLNDVKVSERKYSEDSSQIIGKLKELLHQRKDFFENGAYFDSTRLIIDTIIYSPDNTKMAILLITQNPTSRQLERNRDYDRYYDATAYISFKKYDSIILKWVGPNFSGYYDKKKISEYILTGCFRTFVETDNNEYLYNMNDIRFWTSPIFNSMK